MFRLLAIATFVTIIAADVNGRSVLQDSGSVDPTSFAAKRNTNSQGTVSSDAAVQQGLQNQKTTELQATQTHRIQPQGTSKRTLQQVRPRAPGGGNLGFLHPRATTLKLVCGLHAMLFPTLPINWSNTYRTAQACQWRPFTFHLMKCAFTTTITTLFVPCHERSRRHFTCSC